MHCEVANKDLELGKKTHISEALPTGFEELEGHIRLKLLFTAASFYDNTSLVAY
jgi:hypothetical protein